jgi:ribonuclease HI
MTFNEDRERLLTVVEMIDEYIDEKDMLVSTQEFLWDLKDAASTSWVVGELNVRRDGEKKIVISCDASYVPSRGASIATLIEYPGKSDLEVVNASPAETQNQAEYESIYIGLVSLVNLINRPKYPIEIRSDGKLPINQITGEWKCYDVNLVNKRNAVRELVESLPVEVSFIWRPRCSTEALKWCDEEARRLLQQEPRPLFSDKGKNSHIKEEG